MSEEQKKLKEIYSRLNPLREWVVRRSKRSVRVTAATAEEACTEAEGTFTQKSAVAEHIATPGI